MNKKIDFICHHSTINSANLESKNNLLMSGLAITKVSSDKRRSE